MIQLINAELQRQTYTDTRLVTPPLTLTEFIMIIPASTEGIECD